MSNTTHVNSYPVWTSATLFGLTGSVCCMILIFGVVLLKRQRTSLDLFIGNLCLGCICLSLPFTVQFILNMAEYHFAYEKMCQMEAYLYMMGAILQFPALIAIAWRNYLAVLRQYLLPERKARWFLLIHWLITGLGTYAFGQNSPVTIMPAGGYCLYSLDSPAFQYWFIPNMLLATFSSIYCYISIFRVSQITSTRADRYTGQGDVLVIKVTAPPELPVYGVPRHLHQPKSTDGYMSESSKRSSRAFQKGGGHLSGNGGVLLKSPFQSNSSTATNTPNLSPDHKRHNETPYSPEVVLKSNLESPELNERKHSFNLPGMIDPGLTPIAIDLPRQDDPSLSPSQLGTPDTPSPLTYSPRESIIVRGIMQHRRTKSQMPLRVAKQSIIFVIIFTVGWTVHVACCFYIAFGGTITANLSATLIILNNFHTFAVPLAYGYSNIRLRNVLVAHLPCLKPCIPVSRSSWGRRRRVPRASPKRQLPTFQTPPIEVMSAKTLPMDG